MHALVEVASSLACTQRGQLLAWPRGAEYRSGHQPGRPPEPYVRPETAVPGPVTRRLADTNAYLCVVAPYQRSRASAASPRPGKHAGQFTARLYETTSQGALERAGLGHFGPIFAPFSSRIGVDLSARRRPLHRYDRAARAREGIAKSRRLYEPRRS